METEANQIIPPLEAVPAATPAAAPKAKKTGFVMIIVAVLATALIVGGIIYFWQNSLVQSVSISYEESIGTLNQQVATLQEQMLQLQNEADNAAEKEQEFTEQIAELQYKLEEAEFRLAILDLWGVKNVVRSTDEKNNFYYSSNFGGSANIGYYNLAADLRYNSTGLFEIPSANTIIYNEPVGEERMFRLLSVQGGQLIFWDKLMDDSPGVCFSPWLSAELSSIDLSASVMTKQAYEVSEERKEAEQAEFLKCEGTMGVEPGDDAVMEEGDAMTEERDQMTEDANEEDNS